MGDYKAAYDLAGAVMGESLTELKKPQRKLLDAIRDMGPIGDGVTRREIRERVGLADTRLRELLGELVAWNTCASPRAAARGGRAGTASRTWWRATNGVWPG